MYLFKTRQGRLRTVVLAAGLIAISACNHDDDDTAEMATSAMYKITVTNLTSHQPLTPVAAVIHNNDFTPWMAGEAVSTGLEMLAESGDNSMFTAESAMMSAVMQTASSAGGAGPGESVTIMMTVPHNSAQQLTVASMLARTNDAFTGARNWTIGGLAVDQSATMMTRVYDAGTEANTETADTVPGTSGEGHNAIRDDSNRLTIHAGVVTVDDGLMTSALVESDRWLGAAAKVTVTRMQ